jgi:hypothetical protein
LSFEDRLTTAVILSIEFAFNVFRLQMSAIETLLPSSLTKTQKDILGSVSDRGRVSIEDFRELVDDVRVLIEGGFLRLKIEAYEWGINFELVPNQEFATIRQHL